VVRLRPAAAAESSASEGGNVVGLTSKIAVNYTARFYRNPKRAYCARRMEKVLRWHLKVGRARQMFPRLSGREFQAVGPAEANAVRRTRPEIY